MITLIRKHKKCSKHTLLKTKERVIVNRLMTPRLMPRYTLKGKAPGPKKKKVEESKKPLIGHNPNKRRCQDFHRFMKRMQVIPQLTWELEPQDWKRI